MITVADGASIKLRNVNINGNGAYNDESYYWAGISCSGDTTITLEGENNVKGFYEEYPGIYILYPNTLTINGTGSLDASSNGLSAGIGAGANIPCGNIIIESGNITISGGTINATGGLFGAGIGSGFGSSYGDITISGGNVTAIKGANAPNSIGAGISGTCGTVTIGGVVGAIEDSPYTYPSSN